MDQIRYFFNQNNFKSIPGYLISYWMSKGILAAFQKTTVKNYGFAGIGMRTGDNERFLRFWTEISFANMLIGCHNVTEQVKSNKKWIPYNKGGKYRKWYGNNEYVVFWLNDGEQIKENTRRVYPYLGENLSWKISNEKYYYHEGITWSGVTSGDFSCRLYGVGFIFDSGANGLFVYNDENRLYLAGFLNSKISNILLKLINPTLNTGVGTINQVPLIMNEFYREAVSRIVNCNVVISRFDWDSFETSWDFKKHPLI